MLSKYFFELFYKMLGIKIHFRHYQKANPPEFDS